MLCRYHFLYSLIHGLNPTKTESEKQDEVPYIEAAILTQVVLGAVYYHDMPRPYLKDLAAYYIIRSRYTPDPNPYQTRNPKP